MKTFNRRYKKKKKRTVTQCLHSRSGAIKYLHTEIVALLLYAGAEYERIKNKAGLSARQFSFDLLFHNDHKASVRFVSFQKNSFLPPRLSRKELFLPAFSHKISSHRFAVKIR